MIRTGDSFKKKTSGYLVFGRAIFTKIEKNVVGTPVDECTNSEDYKTNDRIRTEKPVYSIVRQVTQVIANKIAIKEVKNYREYNYTKGHLFLLAFNS